MWPTDNLDSWRRISDFIDEFPESEDWSEWKRIAGALIAALIDVGLDSSFRIGQSMHHIVISTLNHHQLNSEPRVTIAIRGAKREVRIAYSEANLWFSGALEEKTVSEAMAATEVKAFLRRLWQATKPAEDLPDALKPA